MKPAKATTTTTAAKMMLLFIFRPFFGYSNVIKLKRTHNQFIHSFHSREKECENDKNLMF